MNKLELYCVTDKRVEQLETTNYNLAAVGKERLPENYLRCDNGDNIFYKEEYYSELTFHYWFWKNQLQYYNDHDWVGFCQKRRFWVNRDVKNSKISKENLNDYLLDKIPDELNNFDSFLCEPIFVNKVKKIKMLKKGFRSLIKRPSIFFDDKLQTLKFHFDMHHGYGNLDRAIDCLNDRDKEDFRKYMSINIKFNPHIMFISKPEIARKWFSDLFSWLFECEKIFGFKNLHGYETTRLYAYLAERYLSFWFKKYTKYKNLPWILLDTTENKV